jgi:cell division protein FtsN
MNDTLRRRLTGLAVLLFLLFALSWLLPRDWPESGEKGVPSATIPLAVNGPDAGDAQPSTAPQAPAGNAGPASAQAQPQVQGGANEPTPVSAIDASAPPLSENPPAPKPLPPPAPATAKPPAVAASRPDSAHEAKPSPPQARPPVSVAAAAPATTAPKPAPAAAPVKPQPAATKPAAPVAAAAKPPATPAPAPAKPAVAAPVTPKLATALAAPPPAPATAVTRLWYVQIGSFADQGNAQTTLNLLQNIGYRGESRPITSASGSALYRVRLGPFPSEAVGQQALDKVTHQGYPQARLLSEESGKR